MATNPIHQQLNEIGIPNVRERVIQPTSLSGIGSVLAKGFKSFQTGKANKETARQEGVVSGFAQESLSLANDRSRAKIERDRVADMSIEVELLRADGDISDSDSLAFSTYASAVERVNDSQSGGLLNNDVYKIQQRNLAMRALSEAPSLTAEIKSIFRGTKDDVNDLTEAQQADLEVFNQVARLRGGAHNVTPRALTTAVRQASDIQQFQTKLSLGVIEAADISNDISNSIGSQTAAWSHKWQRRADPQGTMSVEDQFEAKAELAGMRAEGQTVLAQYFTTSHQNGKIISDATKDSLRASTDRSYDLMEQMLEGRGVGERLKTYNDSVDEQMQHDLGAPYRALLEMMSKTGITSVKDMTILLKNPDMLKAYVNQGFLTQEEADNLPSASAIITAAFTRITSGFNLEGNRRLSDNDSIVVNTSLGGGTASPSTVSTFTNELLKKVRANEDLTGALTMLNNNVASANLAREMTPEAKAELKASFELMEARFINNTLIAFDNTKGEELILGGGVLGIGLETKNTNPNRFGSTFKIGGGSLSPSATGVGQLRSKVVTQLKHLNDLIKLSENPNYLGLISTTSEIFDSIERTIRERKEFKEERQRKSTAAEATEG